MLTKPLTHLRPLLRLPSHSSPSPEHFSSNPSLLHHLPQHPTSSLVSASQSSAQAAGAGSNAGPSGAGSGRAGWGAGSGNGYTGSARAFLSLQNTASVDPSTGLNHNTDDNQRQKNYLLFKQQLSKRTQVIDLDRKPGVQRQIEAQAGPSLRAVNLDQQDVRRAIESVPEARSRRRSSIAIHSPAAFASPSTPSLAVSPSPSRPLNPTYLRAIPRSQSSLEIWHVGMAPPRQLTMRSMSTRSSSIALPEIDEDSPVPAAKSSQPTRTIRPTRVSQDLAGIDLPGRPAAVRMVRRNSTAAVQYSGGVPELGQPMDEDVFEEEQPSGSVNNPNDLAIYQAIEAASRTNDERLVRKLVQYYRSDRELGPAAAKDDPELVPYSLADGYTTPTYNKCLEALHRLRQPGESIAPMLEMYNELLDRNCVPNVRTYMFVILALCNREKDVWKAFKTWERERQWARWLAEKRGVAYDEGEERRTDHTMKSYRAEGNFASAMRLYQAVPHNNGQGETRARMFQALVSTLAAAGHVSPAEQDFAQGLYNHSLTIVPGARSLLKYMFKIYANAGDVDTLVKEVDAFIDRDLKASDHQGDYFFAPLLKMRSEEADAHVQHERRQIWTRAATSLLQVGQVEKAEAVWGMLKHWHSEDSTQGVEVVVEGQGAPTTERPDTVAYALAMGSVDIKKAIDILRPVMQTPPYWGSLGLDSRRHWVDLLIEHGEHEALVNLIADAGGSANILKKVANGSFARIILALAEAMDRPEQMIRRKALSAFRFLTVGRHQPMDTTLLSSLVSLVLAAAEKYGDDVHISHVWDAFTLGRPLDSGSEEAEAVRLLTRRVATAESQSLTSTLAFVTRALSFVDVTGDAIICSAVASKYLAERAQGDDFIVAVGQLFTALIRVITSYPIEDGEMDDALVQLAKDLGRIASQKETHSDDYLRREFIVFFAARLASRVGEERAVELLTPALGDRAKEFATVRQAGHDDQQAAGLPGPSGPNVVGTPVSPGLTISTPLGQAVDRHTVRRTNLSALDAYDILKSAMQRDHIVAHPTYLARLLDNLSRVGEEDKVRELYALGHHLAATALPDVEQANAWLNLENMMLIATCHLGHLEEAGMYRARIMEAGMLPSADAFATMIACSKDTTDDALVGRTLFSEALALGVQPNLFLYNTIISKLSRARKTEMALDLFKEMKSSGIKPSSVTYGAVINACCRVGDAQSAEVLFKEMASQPDFRARVPPYNTMMQFHLTTVPSRERVLEYYNAMREANVSPSAHTYKLLLDAYAVLPPTNLPAVDRVFREISLDRGVKVLGTHWASVISAYGIFGNDVERAIQLFDSIESQRYGRLDLRSEPVVWEAMFNVLAQKGTAEQLEALRERMTYTGAKATAYVYNVLIAGYARVGMVDRAREVFASMGDSVTGVAAPNNHPQLLTSSGHVKPSTVTDVPTDIVYREPSTYEAMIRVELGVGNVDGAETVLRMMEERMYPVAVYSKVKALLDIHKIQTTAAPSPVASDSVATPEGSTAEAWNPSNFSPKSMPESKVQTGIYAGESKS